MDLSAVYNQIIAIHSFYSGCRATVRRLQLVYNMGTRYSFTEVGEQEQHRRNEFVRGSKQQQAVSAIPGER